MKLQSVFVILFFLSILWACKKTDEFTPIPNRPPNTFIIKANLANDGTTVNLTWTKAIDPDGDKVTYTVFTKDTLAKNIVDTTYTIKNLTYNSTVTGKVIAKDSKGLNTEVAFTIKTATNTAPGQFTVKTRLGSDGKTVYLTWNKAIDPEGDKVTYTVFAKDTLAKNLVDTAYVINNLDYNSTITGKVIAKDPKGLSTESVFSATTATVVLIKIPDNNFEKALIDKKIDTDGQINGQMKQEDALKVTSLSLTGSGLLSSERIKSLIGIEAFINLKTLKCEYSNLTSLDVSKNINLTEFVCSGNQLTSLDISKNIALTNLDCRSNQLTNLDISKNIALTWLYCSDNKFVSLDMSKNSALKILWCDANRMTSLDVSKNINLTYLNCYGNYLTDLDVSKNIVLKDLFCHYNELQTLNLSNALTTIFCNNNNFKSLDMSKSIILDWLDCSSNNLTTLDVSKNTVMTYLDCRSNSSLKIICVKDLNQVKRLWKKDDTANYTVCK
jgi:hypothetical protein